MRELNKSMKQIIIDHENRILALEQKAHSHYMDDGGLRVCREELDDESQDERSCDDALKDAVNSLPRTIEEIARAAQETLLREENCMCAKMFALYPTATPEDFIIKQETVNGKRIEISVGFKDFETAAKRTKEAQPKAQEQFAKADEVDGDRRESQEQGGEDKPIQGCYYDHDDCEAVRDLRARLDDEKKRRVYYQGIVYDVMNSMSNGKMVCGTVDEPSTQVQDGVRLVLKHRNEFEQEAMNLRARLAAYESKEHGGDVSAIYQTDEYGNQTRVYSQSDIDELRARLSVAESNVAKMTNALATGNKITIVTEEYAAVVARLDNVEKENAELKRQKEAWRDEFIILNDVMRDVSACNAYDDDEISRIDKSEVKG